MQSAKRLFATHGFYRTQISDIIKEIKVARGTLYQYFANKEDIFITLLENAYNEWECEIDKAIRALDLATLPPVEYFRQRVRSTLAFLTADPDICHIVMPMGFGLPEELRAATRQLEEKISIIAENDFKLGIHNQHVREDLNVQYAGEMLAGALFRSAHYAIVQFRKDGKAIDVDALADEVVALFAPGIFKAESLTAS